MKCKICNLQCKSNRSLFSHIKYKHNLSVQDYYDLYKKQPNDGHCIICDSLTSFIDYEHGYKKYCSAKCAANSITTKEKREQTNLIKYGCKNISQNDNIKKKKVSAYMSHIHEIKEKVKSTNIQKYGCDWVTQTDIFKEKSKQTCLQKYGEDNYSKTNEYKIKYNQTRLNHINENEENDYMLIDSLNYGTGWYQAKIVNVFVLNHKKYIHKNDLNTIIDYYNSHKVKSKLEETIYSILPTSTIRNSRQIIKPYELDFYIPELNLAIEVNGNWIHSIEHGCAKDYHLMKSLLCRNKGIRLIHIYEFEYLDEQLLLLKNLIAGINNYPINDFNKNNLIDTIPEPEIICDKPYTIYGAGKLIKNCKEVN